MADAHSETQPYPFSMLFGRPLTFWIRCSGCVIVIAALISGLDAEDASSIHIDRLFWGRVLLAALFVGAFLKSMPSQVELGRNRQGWLLAQFALGSLLTPELWSLNVFTIPFAVPPNRRLRWLIIALLVFLAQVAVMYALHASEFAPQYRLIITSPLAIFVRIANILDFLLWNAFGFVGATLVYELAASADRLERTNRELRQLQAAVRESARAEERLRISQELHDAVGHYLTSLSIQLEIAYHRVTDSAQPTIARCQLVTRLLLAEIREAVSSWRAREIDDLKASLLGIASNVHGIETSVDIPEGLPPLEPRAAASLYRCAREAVTNSLRHSKASHLWISVLREKQDLVLVVRDDGIGCSRPVAGNGLQGIVDRINELHGSVSFDSSAGSGFVLTVAVPFEERAR